MGSGMTLGVARSIQASRTSAGEFSFAGVNPASPSDGLGSLQTSRPAVRSGPASLRAAPAMLHIGVATLGALAPIHSRQPLLRAMFVDIAAQLLDLGRAVGDD